MTPEYWPIVIVESPFAGFDTIAITDPRHLGKMISYSLSANVLYARRACMDCLRRQEVPYASHLFFPQILDEMKPEERELGLTAGYALWRGATKVVFYMDRGVSSGMLRARARATELGLEIKHRYIGP